MTIVGDTAISFAAGLAVFPIVFANDLDPSSGPGLVFVTLPLAFSHMPLGLLAAVTFFVLLVVAALASAMALLEMPVAFLPGAWRGDGRSPRPVCAFSCWLIGIAHGAVIQPVGRMVPARDAAGARHRYHFRHLGSPDLQYCFFRSPVSVWPSSADGSFADEFLASELELGSRAVKLLRVVLRYVATPAILAAGLAPLLLRA